MITYYVKLFLCFSLYNYIKIKHAMLYSSYLCKLNSYKVAILCVFEI